MSPQPPFTDVPDAIEEIRAGRMIVVVDDEDRENEGDLTLAAEKVTPEAINFMAKYGRGLVCLAMTEERLEHLNIGPMTAENTSQYGTAFCEAIDARQGVTPVFPRTTAQERFKWRSIPRPDLPISPVPDMSSLFGHAKAEFWCAPGRPRRPWIWRAWQEWPAGIICEIMKMMAAWPAFRT